MVRRSGLYNILLERERQDHARETKRQQVKEHKDLSTRKRRKPISVRTVVYRHGAIVAHVPRGKNLSYG